MQSKTLLEDKKGYYIIINNGRIKGGKRRVIVKKCTYKTCKKLLYYRKYQKVPINIICKEHRKGNLSPAWRTGRVVRSDGYIMLKMNGHPNADAQGYITEHRYVMAKKLRRKLKFKEKIHHINGNIKDNRPENLKLCKDDKDHKQYHLKNRKCSIKSCDKKHYGRGYCVVHYREMIKYVKTDRGLFKT